MCTILFNSAILSLLIKRAKYLHILPDVAFGSYNKVLAWVDIMLEFVVERLFFLVPSLPKILGDLTPNLQVGCSASERA